MIKREEGFTLVELVITMLMFVLIIAAASNTFTDLLKSFKQQSKLAETNIEGAVGLETLRKDLASAGSGLPWNITGDVTDTDADGNVWEHLTGYTEAVSAPPSGTDDPPNPKDYNDGNDATGTDGSAPRAFVSKDNDGVDFSATSGSASDYLVIKAINVSENDAAHKWTLLKNDNTVKEWDTSSDVLVDDDRVIVLSPGGATGDSRILVVKGGTNGFYTRYNVIAGADNDNLASASFAPSDSSERYVVYGVANPNATALRMPFNRVDYFIQRPATISSSCAPNTGVLYRAVVNQNTGSIAGSNRVPILDCVADMQVAFRRDTDNDGIADNTIEDISTLTASTIRDQVKEVRVYILSHEGQKDTTYTHSPTSIRVGDAGISAGRDFNIGVHINYRWRLYVLVVKTENLK